jgi:predicted DNA binding CopG/RHH family protein
MTVERLKHVDLGMAFTEHELARLHAKAAENGLELDEYANDVLRKMLAELDSGRSRD